MSAFSKNRLVNIQLLIDATAKEDLLSKKPLDELGNNVTIYMIKVQILQIQYLMTIEEMKYKSQQR